MLQLCPYPHEVHCWWEFCQISSDRGKHKGLGTPPLCRLDFFSWGDCSKATFRLRHGSFYWVKKIILGPLFEFSFLRCMIWSPLYNKIDNGWFWVRWTKLAPLYGTWSRLWDIAALSFSPWRPLVVRMLSSYLAAVAACACCYSVGGTVILTFFLYILFLHYISK